MADTVDTANYCTVARSDDLQLASAEASGSSTPVSVDKADRAARKAKRIAEAVERSKKEYTAENVYTERGVCAASTVSNGRLCKYEY